MKENYKSSFLVSKIKKLNIQILGLPVLLVAELKAWNFVKKRLQGRRFPGNFEKIFRTTFFIEHRWWLLLIKVLMMVVVY